MISNMSVSILITYLSIYTRGVARILIRGGGEGQTKFPVKWQEFRFEAVTFKKNLLNKEF